MRDDTAAWLEPMRTEAAKTLTYEDSIELRAKASMPAAEADTPFLDWLASQYRHTPGMKVCAIDWIRYGQLLRERLGWHHYPEFPGGEK